MECPFCVGADNMSTRNCANNCNVTLGHNMFFYITNCLPDINFPFSIFNFTFN